MRNLESRITMILQILHSKNYEYCLGSFKLQKIKQATFLRYCVYFDVFNISVWLAWKLDKMETEKREKGEKGSAKGNQNALGKKGNEKRETYYTYGLALMSTVTAIQVCRCV